jgi:hypothetical protein
VIEYLHHLLEENWRHVRLSEDRRIAITSVNIIAATGVQITVLVLGFSPRVLPLTIWMILLGLFGCVACLRLDERAQLHSARARRLRELMEEETGARAIDVLARSDRSHAERHRVLGRIRLQTAFMGINVATLMAGLTYSVFAIVR